METLFNVPSSVCRSTGPIVRQDTVHRKTRVTANPSGFGVTLSYVVQVTDYRVQVTEYRLQSTEYRVQVTEYRLQIPEYRVSLTEYKVHITEYKLRVIGE